MALDAPDLTAREREIARLAAAACPTAAFAERLGIPVCTVDNHLHRAYARLGVGSRGELLLLALINGCSGQAQLNGCTNGFAYPYGFP